VNYPFNKCNIELWSYCS